MSAVPPPVQNSGERCPNCGAYRPPTQAYCANCGYGRPITPAASSTHIVWIVLFIVIGLPSGCLGSCLLLLGMSSPMNPDDWPFWLIVFGTFVVAIGLMIAMIVSLKRRR